MLPGDEVNSKTVFQAYCEKMSNIVKIHSENKIEFLAKSKQTIFSTTFIGRNSNVVGYTLSIMSN